MPPRSNDDDAIEVPGAPPVRGLRFRRFRGPADHLHIFEVVRRSRDADSVALFQSLDEIRAGLESPVNFDPRLDIILAEVHGEPVGYGRVSWALQRDGTRLYYISGFLVPEWRGMGVTEAMLRWSEGRAREVAATHPTDGPRLMSSVVADSEAERIRALEAAGHRPARWLFDMLREGLDDVPELPLPEGIVVRGVPPDRYRDVWEANVDAFAEEWDGVVGTEEAYRRWLANPFMDPSLWQVAWDGELVVGTVLPFILEEENERYSRKWGYTESIMVRKGYRGQGIAKALIARALRAIRARGMEAAILGVDSENASDALRLYEGMGYNVLRRWVTYRKPL